MKHDARVWLRDRRPALYIRESTKRQGAHDRFGPEIQRQAQREAVERFGMREPARTYTDLVSGTNALKRSDFRQMVVDARAKSFDVLLVYDVSRFARNELDAWRYLEELAAARVPVYFCDEDILTIHDEDWKDQIGSVINTAAQYSRKLSRTIRRSFARKWAAGAQAGRPPFGYRRVDKMFIEPDENAPTRALCFTLYATGDYTFDTLVDELNGRGLRIFGRPFTRSALREMFINPIVIGTLARNPRGRREGITELRELAIAPIIERETWDRVQRILEERGKHRRSVRSDRYVFSGAARCRECGSRFWGHNAGSGQYRYRRLEHRPAETAYATSGNAFRCAGVHHESRIIAAFGEFLARWNLRADTKTRIAYYLERRVDDSGPTRRRQLEAELVRLTDLYRWEHIAKEAYLAERGELLRKLAAIPATPRLPSDAALTLIEKLGDVWAKATDTERRRIVDEWFEEVRLGRDRSIEVLVRAPYRELVFSAYGQGQGFEASSPRPYAITLAGYDEWAAFWADEATA